MALLKGSFVLMICQKITIILNIPDRLVLFLQREWGTECWRPGRTLARSMDARRTFVSADFAGTPVTAPPVFDCDLGTYHCEPCLIQLWKLSFEDKCLTLHYLENLNSSAH